MSDWWHSIKENYIFLVIFVGLIGGILSNENKNKGEKNKLRRFIFFVFGTTTSIFLCWISFEITFYFTSKQNLSLAIGGFFSWRGANWVIDISNKIINELIDKIDGKKDERI